MNVDFNNKKILILRPDRIGDVVLSTPVLKTLKKKYPKIHLSFLVQPIVSPLLEGLSFIDELMLFDPQQERGVQKFHYLFLLTQWMREKKFDIALHLQSHPLLAAATFGARIPIRIGPLSKPHSYLFYNYGKKQNRSQVLSHESFYNLELLDFFRIEKKDYVLETEVFLSTSYEAKMREQIYKSASQGIDLKKTVLIHAGMRGSAENWPLEHFKELLKMFRVKGWSVFLTAGDTEQSVLDYFSEFREDPQVFFWGGSKNPLLIQELAALIHHVHCVVAPSTGPLHMAVALKKKVISFYPNIKVQSEKRWGPFPVDRNTALVFSPRKNQNSLKTILPHEVVSEIQNRHFLDF